MMAVIQDATGNAEPDVIFRWAVLLIGQGVVLVGLILGYFSMRGKQKDTNEQATLAAEFSKPTGNGYADDTRASLSEIKATLIRVEGKVDTHIQDHSAVSLRKNKYE